MPSNMMVHTVNVQAPTPTKGTSGAEKDAYTTVYSNKPCLVSPMSNAWKVLYGQRSIEATHTVYFNDGTITVKRGYQLIFGTRTLRVVGVRNAKERGLVLEVDVQELQQ